MPDTVIHLRAETKPLEHRSALTPTTAKALQDAGYDVRVERSKMRIFKDEEFEKLGIPLVPEGSWKDVPVDHIILGLKELPDEDFPLRHTHVTFLHVFKNQKGWERTLGRFPNGGGTLLDLEFLHDENGRRVAAFGYHAGFAGAALGLDVWAWQLTHPGEDYPSISPFPNEAALISYVKEAIVRGTENSRRQPRVVIIGALGRCGRGAVDLCLAAGVTTENVLKWDMAETAKGGPFKEIVESDIFINCIYLTHRIPNFVDLESIANPKRQLSVVVDVSCDTTNPYNPVPIYNDSTTFTKPTLPVPVNGLPPLSVIAIDHLPTLLPREASEQYSRDLLPSLLQLKDRHAARVWVGAEKVFQNKVSEIS